MSFVTICCNRIFRSLQGDVFRLSRIPAHVSRYGLNSSWNIPCKSFLQKRNPHFIGVGVGVGGVNLVSVDDWQIVINEDVIPDTKSPKPTVEHPVIFRGTHGVRVLGNYLKRAEMFTLFYKVLH